MFRVLAPLSAYLMTRLQRERGVTMVEYGIILGLVAIAAVVTIGLVGDKIAAAWDAALKADWP